MPSSCHIDPVWHHSEQSEDAQSSQVSPPATPWMLVWAHNMLHFDRLHFPMQMWFGEKLWAISGENGSKGSVPRHTDTQAELSALLSKNRHKFSARRHKRHFTRGATTSSLLFISLCNNFILRLQGVFFPASLCSGPSGFYRNVHIKQSLAVLYNHPGMQWVSHGALLNTAVHWPSWTINIWSMANVLWGRRFVISVNTKGLLKWPNDFSFTSGVPKVMKPDNTEVENQDVIFLLFEQWEFI